MLRIVDKFKLYLEEYKKVAPTTCAAYVHDIEHFLEFLASKFRTPAVVNAQDFTNYFIALHAKKLSTATAQRKVSALKLFASYLHDKWGLEDYSDDITFDNSAPLLCAPSTFPAILNNLRTQATQFEQLRTYCLLYLLIQEKAPVNALVLLEQSSFNAEHRTLQLESGKKTARTIVLDEVFTQALAQYISLIPYKTSLLFPVKFGSQIKHIPRQAAWSLLRSTVHQVEAKEPMHSIAHENTDPELKDLYRKMHPRA